MWMSSVVIDELTASASLLLTVPMKYQNMRLCVGYVPSLSRMSGLTEVTDDNGVTLSLKSLSYQQGLDNTLHCLY